MRTPPPSHAPGQADGTAAAAGSLRRIGDHLILVAGLLWLAAWLICCTVLWTPVWSFTAQAQRRQRTRAFVARVFAAYFAPLRWLGLLQADLRELDRLRDAGPLVVAPNHPSLLDAFLIASRLPRASCIMKADLMRNPLLGWGARMAGYLRNDSTRALVRDAVEDLSRGAQLIVFPEGTRTLSPPLNPLRGAFATIAHRADVPIQLVAIETSSGFLGKGWPVWRAPRFPLRYRVKLLASLDAGESRETIIARTDAALRQALARD